MLWPHIAVISLMLLPESIVKPIQVVMFLISLCEAHLLYLELNVLYKLPFVLLTQSAEGLMGLFDPKASVTHS